MFARVTKFKMKAGVKEAALVRLDGMKDHIMGMPGMIHFVSVMNDDGSGYVVSIVESEETSNANAPQVQQAWGQMAEFLEEPPTPEGYDVMANWGT